MDEAKHLLGEAFVGQGLDVLRLIDAYWARLRTGDPGLPVRSRVKPGEVLGALPESAPEDGQGWDESLRVIDETVLPGLTHWQHPGFFGYFPANASGPAVLGELLAAGLGVNGMLWATSPAATEMEMRVLDWLQEALGLPAHFRNDSAHGGGVIQGTASEATLVALLAARNRARRAGCTTPVVAYCSAQAHSSVLKAGMIAGLADGSDGAGFDGSAVRLVPTNTHMAMDVGALWTMIEQDRAAGKTPVFVCATLGTTGTMAFDDLPSITRAIDGGATPIWLHVDAAMAGAAWVCPELRSSLDGIERADSLCFNPHKWLLTSFDCDLFWTRDKRSVTGALGITPEYLKTGAGSAVTDYRDWQVPLGRRFRALKLWLVLRHYGLASLRAYIREHLRIAQIAEDELRADERFELPTPRHESSPLVVFRVKGDEGTAEAAIALNTQNAVLLERINAGGRAMLSHTTLPPLREGWPMRYVLRLAIGGTFTREEHVRVAVGEIRGGRDEAAGISH